VAKCSECGAVVADDLKFCGYCGARIDVIDSTLASRILAKTDSVLLSLSKLTTVDELITAGAVVSGEHQGKLLYVNKGNGGLFISDGQAILPADGFVEQAWSAGLIEASPSLVTTCPVCLGQFHAFRGLAIEPASIYGPKWYEYRVQIAAGWVPNRAACPICAAKALAEQGEGVARNRRAFANCLVYGQHNLLWRYDGMAEYGYSVLAGGKARRARDAAHELASKNWDQLYAAYTGVLAQVEADRLAFPSVVRDLSDYLQNYARQPISTFAEQSEYVEEVASHPAISTMERYAPYRVLAERAIHARAQIDAATWDDRVLFEKDRRNSIVHAKEKPPQQPPSVGEFMERQRHAPDEWWDGVLDAKNPY